MPAMKLDVNKVLLLCFLCAWIKNGDSVPVKHGGHLKGNSRRIISTSYGTNIIHGDSKYAKRNKFLYQDLSRLSSGELKHGQFSNNHESEFSVSGDRARRADPQTSSEGVKTVQLTKSNSEKDGDSIFTYNDLLTAARQKSIPSQQTERFSGHEDLTHVFRSSAEEDLYRDNYKAKGTRSPRQSLPRSAPGKTPHNLSARYSESRFTDTANGPNIDRLRQSSVTNFRQGMFMRQKRSSETEKALSFRDTQNKIPVHSNPDPLSESRKVRKSLRNVGEPNVHGKVIENIDNSIDGTTSTVVLSTTDSEHALNKLTVIPFTVNTTTMKSQQLLSTTPPMKISLPSQAESSLAKNTNSNNLNDDLSFTSPMPEPRGELGHESSAKPEPISETTAGSETTAEPTSEAIPEPTSEATPKPVSEATPKSTPEAKPEPVSETTPKPTSESKPEPVSDITPKPTPEPVSETTPKPTPEPVSETTPKSSPESKPELVSEITPEPVSEITPEPEPVSETTPKLTSKPTPEPVTGTTRVVNGNISKMSADMRLPPSPETTANSITVSQILTEQTTEGLVHETTLEQTSEPIAEPNPEVTPEPRSTVPNVETKNVVANQSTPEPRTETTLKTSSQAVFLGESKAVLETVTGSTPEPSHKPSDSSQSTPEPSREILESKTSVDPNFWVSPEPNSKSLDVHVTELSVSKIPSAKPEPPTSEPSSRVSFSTRKAFQQTKHSNPTGSPESSPETIPKIPVPNAAETVTDEIIALSNSSMSEPGASSSEPTPESSTSEPEPDQGKTEPGQGKAEPDQGKAEPDQGKAEPPAAEPSPEVPGDTTGIPIAEPGPEWDIAKKKWSIAWEIHLYMFGGIFALIAFYSLMSVIRLYQINRLLSKGYFITLNFLVFALCVLRAVYLIVDGYNSNDTFHPVASYLLYSTAFPCLTSAFSILLYALLQATQMKLVPPRVQKIQVLAVIIFFHFLLQMSTDVLVGLYAGMSIMLFVCQLVFILWGLFLFIGYAYIFRHLYSSAVKRQKNYQYMLTGKTYPADAESYKQKFTLSLAVKVTFMASIFGLVTIGLEIYAIVDVYGVFSLKKPEPWPWWLYHTALRLVECAMCLIMAYVASQPFRYRDLSTCGFLCSPCMEIFHCGNRRDQSDKLGWSEYDRLYMTTNKRTNGHTNGKKKKIYLNEGTDIVPIVIQPSTTDASRPPSMLIIEDGYVRFQAETDINKIVDNYSKTHTEMTTFKNTYDGIVNGAYIRSMEDTVRFRDNKTISSDGCTRKSRKSSLASSGFFRPPSSISLADSMESEIDKAFKSMRHSSPSKLRASSKSLPSRSTYSQEDICQGPAIEAYLEQQAGQHLALRRSRSALGDLHIQKTDTWHRKLFRSRSDSTGGIRTKDLDSMRYMSLLDLEKQQDSSICGHATSKDGMSSDDSFIDNHQSTDNLTLKREAAKKLLRKGYTEPDEVDV